MKRRSLRIQILYFCAIVLISGLLNAVTLYYSYTESKSIALASESAEGAVFALQSAALTLSDISVAANEALRTPSEEHIANCGKPLDRLQLHLAKVAGFTSSAAAKVKVEEVQKFAAEDLSKMIKTFQSDLKANAVKASANYETEFKKGLASISDALDDCGAQAAEDLKQLKVQRQSATTKTVAAEGAILLLSILGSVIYGVYLARSLSSSLQSIGSDLRDCSSQLSSIAIEAETTSNALLGSADELSQTSVAASRSVEEVSQSAQTVAQDAKRCRSIAEECRLSVHTGRTRASDMVRSIDEIGQARVLMSTAIADSEAKMQEILQTIQTIAEKTTVINDIVFQTRLLSFNASVEAARAGEHGKSFAVVAEEVGNLAQMSGVAAREISSLLSDSSRKVVEIVNANKLRISEVSRTSLEKTEQGFAIARACDTALVDIEASIDSLNGLVVRIADSVETQCTLTDSTLATTSKFQTGSSAVTSNANSSQTAAKDLKSQSEDLLQMIRRLEVAVSGGVPGASDESERLAS
jgi:methyl-accepting chemotaxis protein